MSHDRPNETSPQCRKTALISGNSSAFVASPLQSFFVNDSADDTPNRRACGPHNTQKKAACTVQKKARHTGEGRRTSV